MTYSGQFAHISGHPSAAGRAQDSESSLARDRRSTAVPCNELVSENISIKLLIIIVNYSAHLISGWLGNVVVRASDL